MFDFSSYINEFGGNSGKYFSRNIFIEIGSENYAADFNAFKTKYRNQDIYKCVYAYENQDITTCKLYAPLYFDLDGDIKSPSGFEKLKRDVFAILVYFVSIGLSMDDIDLYFSGSKGFHVIIPAEVLGIQPDEKLNELYKAWAYHLYNTYNITSLDLGIYDRRRLLRIPGSINSKTGLYKVKLNYNMLKKMDYNALTSYAGNVFNTFHKEKERTICVEASLNFYRKSQPFFEKDMKPNKSEPVKLPEEKQELLPCVKELLETSVSTGCRNNMAVMLASGLFQSGYTDEEIRSILLSWNQNNVPPLPEREIELVVTSAYDMIRSGKKYGCSTFKEYGFCSNDCKLESDRNGRNS